ncbi:MAG: rod shape-determining protein MreD [Acidobacteriota bacterium]|nr:MAG: rod shape-determining protein MreD [Acidobacteriota bacterium]
MENTSRGTTLIIFGCLIAAVFLKTTLQQLAPATPGLWFQHIDWLLLITVYIGLQRDPVRSLITGTVAGILHDSFSGGQAVGVSGLCYIVAAFLTHRITAVIVVDNLLIRFLAVAVASVSSSLIRLLFYRLLGIELPVLADGGEAAQMIVFGLFANLIASLLLFMLLDRIFKKDIGLRMRRSEARRRRL